MRCWARWRRRWRCGTGRIEASETFLHCGTAANCRAVALGLREDMIGTVDMTKSRERSL
ncbi:hypothetical protein MPL3356_40047 [Mesorhizobium plurifarium]|uniref:Uncharacterized protein n=1 Tax=Mesorhizobium plurifarium TaxID=69974 RepID=A0A090E5W0_MESPL|nr:hypothetical protein MPL3356_40047 [Mesorhizobium plurifarium]